jgi:hypothetical protein
MERYRLPKWILDYEPIGTRNAERPGRGLKDSWTGKCLETYALKLMVMISPISVAYSHFILTIEVPVAAFLLQITLPTRPFMVHHCACFRILEQGVRARSGNLGRNIVHAGYKRLVREYVYICLSIYLYIYGSTALVDLGRFFSFLIYTQLIGLLGRGISPSQGRYLHTEQHKHRINAHRCPCLEWGSNSGSQCSSRRRRFMP